MAERKPTKLTRKEREMVALLARLARAVKMRLYRKDEDLYNSLTDAEFDVRNYWKLRR